MPATVSVIALALDLLVALGRSRRGLTPPGLGVDGALVDQSPGLLNRRLVHLVSGHAAGSTRWRPPRTAADKDAHHHVAGSPSAAASCPRARVATCHENARLLCRDEICRNGYG